MEEILMLPTVPNLKSQLEILFLMMIKSKVVIGL